MKETTMEQRQREELQQMQKRVKELAALQHCFAQRLNKDGSRINGSTQIRQLSEAEIFNYTQLLEEQVAAVLSYQKVAVHWPILLRHKAQAAIDQSITAHGQLSSILAEQCQVLARRIEKTSLVLKKNSLERQTSYSDHHSKSGYMLSTEA